MSDFVCAYLELFVVTLQEFDSARNSIQDLESRLHAVLQVNMHTHNLLISSVSNLARTPAFQRPFNLVRER
jgi:hypothetical protein